MSGLQHDSIYRCRIAILAAVLLAGIAGAFPVVAQDYAILGSVETRGLGVYRKDSPVVADRNLRGTWYGTALTRLEATHRFTLGGGRSGDGAMPPAELLLDHALTLVPVNTSDGSSATDLTALGVDLDSTTATGTGGTGSAAATAVFVTHELYQGYVSVFPADWLSLRLGRQRLNWGSTWVFPVTDALHPQSSDSEVEPGFDGVSVSLLPSANLSLEGAVAVQDIVASGDMEEVRVAAYLNAYLAPLDVSLSVVHQPETMLRPGIGFSLPVGPVLLAAEGAMENYDPRGRVLNTQPLASLGVEYTWYGDVSDLVLVGEYFYNGLEETYPGVGAGDLVVTRDAAGGFQRPGRHYAAGTAGFSVSDSWSTEHTVYVNLSDESYLVRHGLTLVRIPALDLAATVTWNGGEAATEFGLLPEGMIVELGATAHF